MFSGCTSLTTAPALLAESLVDNCYKDMFNGCTNLNEITMIGKGTIPSTSLSGWVTGVAATGDFYGHVKATLSEGVNGIPNGWLRRNEFYVEAVEGGTLSYNGSGLQYSKNWEDWKSNGITSITVAPGDIVRFRGVRNGGTISSTGNFIVAGNILSLAAMDYTTVTTGTFTGIFKNSAKLVSAGDLVMPSTLQANCFKEMFFGCASLATAPTLPATTMEANCYQSMFEGCSNLTTAPNLPASTLATECYKQMFKSCSSLTTAPALACETLVEGCYNSMFRECTSLAAAPALPAATLVRNCYSSMFNGCSSLRSVICMATSGINSNGSTSDWLNGVPNTADDHGEFVYNGSAVWPRNYNGIPTYWVMHAGINPVYPNPFGPEQPF
jgi:hypothetical protein